MVSALINDLQSYQQEESRRNVLWFVALVFLLLFITFFWEKTQSSVVLWCNHYRLYNTIHVGVTISFTFSKGDVKFTLEYSKLPISTKSLFCDIAVNIS